MTTSASVDFSLTRDNIITMALQLTGVVEEGGTASANQITDAARFLNALCKEFMTKGLQLWTTEEIVVFPILDTVTLRLGGSSTDRMTKSDDFIHTTISADEAASQTTLSVTSSTGMATSDKVGIVMDSGGIHWTTISSIPDSTSIIIASAITGAASSGNRVYTYTTTFGSASQLPKRVLEAWTQSADSISRDVDVISRNEYSSLANKISEGYIYQVFFDPQLTESLLSVWQRPGDNNMDQVLYLYIQRIIEDFDATGDTPDFPQEWYLALVYNLAMSCAVVWGCTQERFNRIASLAKFYLDEASNFDIETTSIYLQPKYNPTN